MFKIVVTEGLFFVRSKYFLKNALFFPPQFSSTVLTFDLCSFQYFICNLIGYPYCLKKEKITVMENAHLYETIHLLRKHIFRNFGPPSLIKHVFSTESKQKLPFSNPPPPSL